MSGAVVRGHSLIGGFLTQLAKVMYIQGAQSAFSVAGVQGKRGRIDMIIILGSRITTKGEYDGIESDQWDHC